MYLTQPNPKILSEMVGAEDVASELARLRADMATVRLFLMQLEKDERWKDRARAILRIIK